MQTTILIADDDPVQLRLLEKMLSKSGFVVLTASNGEEALRLLDSKRIDALVLDLVMPDLDGMAVLEHLKKKESTVPVIVQTSQGGIDTVVSAMRAGAYDFVIKPFSPERLQISIQNALKMNTLENELQRSKRARAGHLTFSDLITTSSVMKRVIDLGERAAASAIPILLEGESGVGKEMMARAIQGSSNRHAKPFITVNCGAIPENLVESILFGHEKGAFTGAVEKQIGKFQEAHRGTLFLDEVGELPLDVQVKLLRALQEGEIDPVGAKTPVKVDIRLISATNRSLLDMVKQGHFREDLYYRLHVFPITVPPLRERHEDIHHLARHFTARFAAEEGRRHIRGISQEALQLLLAYDWPGNIRQLENALFRAVILCDSTEVTPRDLPQITTALNNKEKKAASKTKMPMPQPSPYEPSNNMTDQNMIGRYEQLTAMHQEAQQAAMQLLDITDNMRPLDDLEAEIISTAMRHYGGQMSEVARRLGIGRSTLYRKVKEYNIDIDAA